MTKEIGWGNIILFIFTVTNASYFMNLFFFYSGYFVPKSFDKKGMYSFLFDRAKRLGVPFVVYTFFLGPFVYSGESYGMMVHVLLGAFLLFVLWY